MFSIDEYAENHKSQIIIGRKTPQQLINYVLNTLPATTIPITSIDPIIIKGFIETLSNSPLVSSTKIKADISTCHLIKIYPSIPYTNYIDHTYKWIYLLIEQQSGELESNCSKLTLDLYIYRGISKQALTQKGMEYLIYVNYLKLLNEMK